MLRSAAASNGQQVSKRGEHGRPEPETALPSRGRRFYLLTLSPLRVGGFAYLRTSRVLKNSTSAIASEGAWRYSMRISRRQSHEWPH